jgi:hypothetical protein
MQLWLVAWVISVPYQVALVLSIAIPSASGFFFNIHDSLAAIILPSQLAAYSQLLFLPFLGGARARGGRDRGAHAVALVLAGFCSALVLVFTVLQRIRMA